MDLYYIRAAGNGRNVGAFTASFWTVNFLLGTFWGML